MKSKKLFLPTVILAVTILAMVVFSLIYSIAKKPAITEADFPFTITYEVDGETKTISEILHVRYDKNDGYNNTKNRFYVATVGDSEEEAHSYVIKETEEYLIYLYTNLPAPYLMGDPEYAYYENRELAPELSYSGPDGYVSDDGDYLESCGVRIISWEYPTPIENSLVFSHLSVLDGGVVIPFVLMSLVAALIILICVKREHDISKRAIDIVSIALNFFILIFVLPYFTVCGWLLDALGDNEGLFSQLLYVVPAITALGIAASVAFRRKGYSKSSLFVQLVGPAVFIVMMIIGAILGL